MTPRIHPTAVSTGVGRHFTRGDHKEASMQVAYSSSQGPW